MRSSIKSSNLPYQHPALASLLKHRAAHFAFLKCNCGSFAEVRMATRRCLLVLAAAAAVASAGETLPGPETPSLQQAWLQNLTQWRGNTLSSINFDPSIYNSYATWKNMMFIAPQSHLYDRFLFDSDSGLWTVDKFLNDLTVRYGGVDGCCYGHRTRTWVLMSAISSR